MLASPLPPSFLDTYSLSMSSLGCKALSIVINFLALWFICLGFSLVYSKKGPEYLSRETTQVFIPLMRFLRQSLASRSFLVRLRFTFYFFLHLCLLADYYYIIILFCEFFTRIPVVHIPFVRMVKFKLLVQSSVDHLPHPVVSSPIFFLP